MLTSFDWVPFAPVVSVFAVVCGDVHDAESEREEGELHFDDWGVELVESEWLECFLFELMLSSIIGRTCPF